MCPYLERREKDVLVLLTGSFVSLTCAPPPYSPTNIRHPIAVPGARFGYAPGMLQACFENCSE